jgi:hypothetical protein
MIGWGMDFGQLTITASAVFNVLMLYLKKNIIFPQQNK